MLLIIIGLFLLISASTFQKNKMSNYPPSILRIGQFAGGILVLIGILSSCMVQINAGQVGVQSLFGKVQKDVLNSGLNFINPLMDVEKMDIKTLNYTMSGIHDEGEKAGDDAIKVLNL